MAEGESDEASRALAALRDAALRQDGIDCLGPEIRRAASTGASWHHIAAAIGIERTAAWEQVRRSVNSAIEQNARSDGVLADAQAMQIAVAETKAVRAERARRGHAADAGRVQR